jgi:hypothetical protein
MRNKKSNESKTIVQENEETKLDTRSLSKLSQASSNKEGEVFTQEKEQINPTLNVH